MTAGKTFMRWLPQAVFITAICLLVYVAGQQDLRQSANDPQIQIAEDAAAALANGVSANDIAESVKYGGYNLHSNSAPGQVDNVDITDSLRPFVFIFDQSGNIIASSVTIGGETPAPPVGVFAYVTDHIEDRFTWQPLPQARIAAIMLKVSVPATVASSSEPAAGFVLAGRSLREVEDRESQLLNVVALVWIILLILSLGYSIFISGRNGQNGNNLTGHA